MPSLLQRVLPPTPLARKLSVQSVLFAVGEGTFMTGNAVFFTHIVGLTAAQVGLGLTLAGVATFFLAVPLGRLADRVGPRRMWALGALAEAVLYLAYPWVRGFGSFLAMVILLELVGATGGAGRGAYTLDVFPARSACGRWRSCAAPSTSGSRWVPCLAVWPWPPTATR